MKRIELSLSQSFKLTKILGNQLFELENNSCEIAVRAVIVPHMAYEFHFECDGEKTRILGEIHDDIILCKLPASLLSKRGLLMLQMRGNKEDDTSIESNAIAFEVGSFINATHQPTPEEESEIERLFVRVTEVETKALTLEGDVDKLKETDVEQDEMIAQAFDEINKKANQTALENLAVTVGEFASDLEKEISDRHEAETAIDADIERINTKLDLKANTADVNGAISALDLRKQNKLKAGANITIEGDTISAVGGGSEGDVTKKYLEDNYYDKPFINELDTLVTYDEGEEISIVEERDISYSNIPLYCGKWVDGKDIHRRVYVVTSGIAKGNTIKVADKPANMEMLIRGFGIVEGTASATKHTMTNSDVSVYVNNDGVYAINNFTGYAERMYIVLEYTVSGGSV